MPTTPNMNLVTPTEGGDSDVWDTILNTLFGLVDSHDHTAGNGVKVPSAALKINADVSWAFGGANYAITDLKAVDFVATASAGITGYAGALFVNSTDANNLYFRTVGGVNVKITDGSTLNVSIVGGIGGDYASVGALLDYDDATDSYRFRQETSVSVRQFAKLSSADLIVREYDPAGDASVPTNTVTIRSPDALAGSYSLTLPAALPLTDSLLRLSPSGVLAASGTIDESLTFASNRNITLAGTGKVTASDFRHTQAIAVQLPACMAVDRIATHTKQTGGSSGAMNRYLLAASTNPLVWPIPVRIGDRITSYAVFFDKNTNGTNNITARLYKTAGDTGTETALGAGSNSSADAPNFISLSETGLSIDVTDDDVQFYLVVTPGGGITPAADDMYSAYFTVTRP